MEDQEYLKSQNQYLEGQKILIEHLELNIVNDENMISIHQRALSNNTIALAHEKMQLEKYLKLYPYLKECNINASERDTTPDVTKYL